MSVPPAPREETKAATAVVAPERAVTADSIDEKLKTPPASSSSPPAEYAVVLAVSGSVNELIVFASLGPQSAAEVERVRRMMRTYAPEYAHLKYGRFFDSDWRRPDVGKSSSSSSPSSSSAAAPSGGLRCTLEGRAARECALRFREALLGAEAAADATTPQLFTVANFAELLRASSGDDDKRHACEDVVGWLLLESGGGGDSATAGAAETNNDDGAERYGTVVHAVPWNRSTATSYELPTLPTAAADETTRAAQAAAAAWGWVCATCRYRFPHSTRVRGGAYCLLCEPSGY